MIETEFPAIVHCETTNICNLKCIHCPHNDIFSAIPDYKPSNIDLNLWEQIVDEVSINKGTLRLTPDGEPLLPAFVEQFSYINKSQLKSFCFNTHGMFLDGENANLLLNSRADLDLSVEISLDALYRSTYEKIRLNSDYNRVINNIFSFLRRRDELQSKNISIFVSAVAQPELGMDELKNFVDFWRPIVDKVIIRNYVDTKGLTPSKGVENREVGERWPCPVPFTRLVVTYDGSVRFCPDDWQKGTIVGKLEPETTLKQIWNSSEMKEIRQSHLNKNFNHPVCKSCTDWKTIRWGKDYVSLLQDQASDDSDLSNLDYISKYLIEDNA